MPIRSRPAQPRPRALPECSAAVAEPGAVVERNSHTNRFLGHLFDAHKNLNLICWCDFKRSKGNVTGVILALVKEKLT